MSLEPPRTLKRIETLIAAVLLALLLVWSHCNP